jgi:hypothetical protein
LCCSALCSIANPGAQVRAAHHHHARSISRTAYAFPPVAAHGVCGLLGSQVATTRTGADAPDLEVDFG